MAVWLTSVSMNTSRRGNISRDAREGTAFICASSSLLRRSWEVVVWVMGTVSEMSLLQTIPAVLLVTVGASEPEDWPLVFGSPAHAYSVRPTTV